MNIIVIGPQGSGKTTQAAILAQKLHLPHLQTGEVYRRLAKEDTPLGRQIMTALSAGQLVPEKIHRQIMTQELSQAQYRQGFVLDGSPRTLDQVNDFPDQIDRVFYLKVSDKENIKRLLLRQRDDDRLPIIKKRLDLFHRQTEPVLNYYRQKGILEEIDGERSIEDISVDLYRRCRVMTS